LGPRTILHTGKGGVGKTTATVATARRAAAEGLRTLALSIDATRDLALLLDAELDDEPRQVGPSLWARELRPQAALERAWTRVQERLGGALVERGVDAIAAEQLAVPPGADALAAVMRLREHLEDDDFDVVVVDCPATEQALRLLALPDVLAWWLERAFPQRSQLAAAARPLGRAALEVSLPADAMLADVQRVTRDAIAAGDLLRDHERVSVRVVTSDEPLSVAHARRALTCLGLYGILADAVVASGGGELDFAPVPFVALEHAGAALLRERVPQELVLGGDGAELRLDLPFARREDVTVKKVGLELVVRVDGHKRAIALPPALAGHRAAGARLEDGELRVRFDA
jgi:arsenite/tail-anchored protein-transporting ATPase